MQRILLLVCLVIAALVDGFFALVNFYPVAPPRSRGARRYVLAEFDPIQAVWYQRNVLDEFNDLNSTNLQLRVVPEEQLLDQLAAARAGANDALLVALPTELAVRASREQRVRAFDEVIPAAQIARDLSDIQHDVVLGARIGGRQWFLPRSAVLDLAVYRISRVRDAEEHWTLLRPQIEAALRAANGRGLPAGYEFEHLTSRWDSYDVFVLGYYWAHRAYDGDHARPRLAQRTGDELDAYLDIAAGIYRHGGTDATLARFDSEASLDYFSWQSVLHQHGLYSSEMYDGDALDDEELLQLVQDGAVYFASLDQVEAFTLHGFAHRDARSRVQDPDDLGFVAMPHGVSLDLDAHGHPVRTAAPFSFREEHVWALPANGPSPALAYEFVKYSLSRENHVRECGAIGTLPIRIDVNNERASMFRVPWMAEIFDAASAQWPRSELVPPGLITDRIGSRYAAVWSQLAQRHGQAAPTRAEIAAILRSPPSVAPTPRSPQNDVSDRRRAPASTTTHASVTDTDFAPPIDPDSWRDRVVLEGLDASSAATTSDAGTRDAGSDR